MNNKLFDTLLRWSWVFGVLGFLSLVVTASLVFVFREQTQYVTGFGTATIVLLIAYVALDRERLGDAMSSRGFIYGSGSTLMVIMATGIAVFGYVLADQHDETWDLTQSKQFTLSDQSKSALDALEQPVEILAFFQDGSQNQREFRDLSRRYEDYSKRISVRFIDPLAKPLQAERHKITNAYGTVLLRVGDDERRMEGKFDEDALTRELLLMSAGAEHKICWSLGHGEPDPDDEQTQRGFGNIVLKLEDLNYQVDKTFVMTGGIDRNCEVLVVANPIIEWFPFERESLAAYVAEGGQVLMMLDVEMVPELSEEMARYGVQVGNDLVLDASPENMLSGVQDPSMVVLSGDNFFPHPITKNMSAAIVLGLARSVGPIPGTEGVALMNVLETGDQAWAETDLSGKDGEPAPNPGVETIGKVPVMVVSEVKDPAALEVARPDTGEEEKAIANRVRELLSYRYGVEASAVKRTSRLVEDLKGDDDDLIAIDEALTQLFGVSIYGELQEGKVPDPPKTVGDIIDRVVEGKGRFAVNTGADPTQIDLDGAVAKAVPEDFAPKAGGRIVVVGDSDFANNQLMKWGNNKDLFLNTIAWMVDEEEQIGERPEAGDSLEISVLGTLTLFLITFILAPGASLMFALIAVLRRRWL